jgi:hypothetical protein
VLDCFGDLWVWGGFIAYQILVHTRFTPNEAHPNPQVPETVQHIPILNPRTYTDAIELLNQQPPSPLWRISTQAYRNLLFPRPHHTNTLSPAPNSPTSNLPHHYQHFPLLRQILGIMNPYGHEGPPFTCSSIGCQNPATVQHPITLQIYCHTCSPLLICSSCTQKAATHQCRLCQQIFCNPCHNRHNHHMRINPQIPCSEIITNIQSQHQPTTPPSPPTQHHTQPLLQQHTTANETNNIIISTTIKI